jgi:simple sugar transport system permease protein
MRLTVPFVQRNRFQITLFVSFIIFLLFLIYKVPEAYLKADYYIILLRTFSIYSIIAFALTILVAAGEMDISFGSTLALATYVFTQIFKNTGNAFLGMVVALIIGGLLGFLNGVITTQFKLPSLLVTLGTMLAWRGLVYFLTQGYDIPIPEISHTVFYNIFGGDVMGVPVQIVWAIIFFAFFYILLNHHKFGNHVRCTGDNIDAARNMGINTIMTKIICFTFVGLMSTFSGIMTITNIKYYFPLIGSEDVYLFPILTAVFMGGTPITGGSGSITGSLIATIIINVAISGIIALGFSGFYTTTVLGFFLIIVLALNYKLKYRR